MYVTFVNPPSPKEAHQQPLFAPLGIGHLAPVLEENEYRVNVIDCQTLKLTYARAGR